MKIKVTDHALERYSERIGIGELHVIRKAIMNKSIFKHRDLIAKYKEQILKCISNANIDKSVFNDMNKMMKLYDRYGYDTRYRFFNDGEAIYVGLIEGSNVVVVTCYPVSEGEKIARKKFRRNVVKKS